MWEEESQVTATENAGEIEDEEKAEGWNAGDDEGREEVRPSRGFAGLDRFPGFVSSDSSEGQGLLERM